MIDDAIEIVAAKKPTKKVPKKENKPKKKKYKATSNFSFFVVDTQFTCKKGDELEMLPYHFVHLQNYVE